MSKNNATTVLSAAEQAYRELEELIVLTDLNPGQLYSEKELESASGFGRTPVREALQRLQTEGLVEIKQRRGIQITAIDADIQLQLLEVRRPLQNFIAEYAAQNSNEQDRSKIRALATELKSFSKNGVPTKAQALSAIRNAHDAIVSACHNVFATKTMRIVQSVSRRFWVYHIKPDDFKEAAKLHSNLLNKIAEGDTEASVQASQALMDYLEEFARNTKSW